MQASEFRVMKSEDLQIGCRKPGVNCSTYANSGSPVACRITIGCVQSVKILRAFLLSFESVRSLARLRVKE